MTLMATFSPVSTFLPRYTLRARNAGDTTAGSFKETGVTTRSAMGGARPRAHASAHDACAQGQRCALHVFLSRALIRKVNAGARRGGLRARRGVREVSTLAQQLVGGHLEAIADLAPGAN